LSKIINIIFAFLRKAYYFAFKANRLFLFLTSLKI